MADALTCVSCSKQSDNLKRCAKCKTTPYCSRECQKADWKVHKKICGKNAAEAFAQSSRPSTHNGNASGHPKGLNATIDKPFHRIDRKTWLHDRPEEDVYKLLIDCYRLRMEDNYKFEGEADVDSIYGGAPSGLKGFQRFLALAQNRKGLLPPWWTPEKAKECERVGMDDPDGWSSLSRSVEKTDIIEHYGDNRMPMQLRLLGEQVYGRGPGGQPGAATIEMMKQVEAGGMTGTTLDVSSLMGRR